MMDYVRLLYWFLWFPKGYKQYIRYHASYRSIHWWNVQWMTAAISTISAMVAGTLSVVMLYLLVPNNSTKLIFSLKYLPVAMCLSFVNVALALTALYFLTGRRPRYASPA